MADIGGDGPTPNLSPQQRGGEFAAAGPAGRRPRSQPRPDFCPILRAIARRDGAFISAGAVVLLTRRLE
jgi:hypothetical protein